MENSSAAVAAIIFIVAIVGINVMMYGVVRGVMRGGKDDPLLKMMKAMNPAQKKKEDEMEELRRTVHELNKSKENKNGESE
jgi:ABC-type lipoprotein release transport system permease subunit